MKLIIKGYQADEGVWMNNETFLPNREEKEVQLL